MAAAGPHSDAHPPGPDDRSLWVQDEKGHLRPRYRARIVTGRKPALYRLGPQARVSRGFWQGLDIAQKSMVGGGGVCVRV